MKANISFRQSPISSAQVPRRSQHMRRSATTNRVVYQYELQTLLFIGNP
jgi:hypothetical protein